MCGEKILSYAVQLSALGSPPRVRGEDDDKHIISAVEGITPACAGRSEKLRFENQNNLDHPRVCGEKPVVNPRFQLGKGSPPRVRGEGRSLSP